MLSQCRAMMLAVAGVAAFPAGAASAAATKAAAVTANVVKPLTLTSTQNLDFGTVVLGPGAWANARISLSQAGVRTCASPQLTCNGAATVARYRVTGSNRMTVNISAPDVVLTSQTDASQRLTLVLDAPRQVVLTSSGNPGTIFPVGGSILVNSTTAGGVYSGTLKVTVDYP